MEVMYEFIFKVTSAYPHVLIWFTQNQDKWRFLSQWASSIHFPLTEATGVKLLKKRQQYQQYPQYLKQEAYKNSFLRQARIERMRLLEEGQPSAAREELDLALMDFEDTKFKIGDQLEMYYKKTDAVTPVTVEEVLDEMIKVKYVNYNQND